VDKDGGDDALSGAEDSGESDSKKSERDESGGVQMDGTEGEGGDPLGLGEGEAMGEPREESSAKKDFFRYGRDDQGVGEEGEKGFCVAGFEEAGHGRLRFEWQAKGEGEKGACEQENDDGNKKSEHGAEGEGEVADGLSPVKTPE
jgi:hypothetical protein